MPGFNKPGENKEDDGNEDGVRLSFLIETILLGYFYLLVKRKVLTGDLAHFWGMDTYQFYALLNWENQLIESEPTGEDETGSEGPVGDSPHMAEVFHEFINEDEEE